MTKTTPTSPALAATHRITLRTHAGLSSPDDLIVKVQEKTYDYLMTATVEKIRVSAYLDHDAEQVLDHYAELFVDDACPYHSHIEEIIPGSRSRQGIELPGAMTTGEQLTVLVVRAPKVSGIKTFE